MLKGIVTFSLRFRGVVLVLAAVLLGYGLYIARNAKLDVFPNFVQPQVVIQTECPGLGPEKVELLVTVPLETAVNGLGDMESLRSESIEGLSIITAVFKENTDVFRARQTLAEKLAEMSGALPAGVKTPRLTPLTSSTMDLLKIGLVSDRLSPMQLRTFADWTVKPRLLSVPGVAKCSTFGGEVRQYQIQVMPDRLAAYGLGLQDVLSAARVSTGVRGAGFIDTPNQRLMLQTEGEALSPDQLGDVVVTYTNGLAVRLKDLARVQEGAEPKMGDTLIQGHWGVLMTLSSQYGANTLEVTKAVETALEEMRRLFDSQGITLYDRLHRPATFIEVALRNMGHSLVWGAVLVAIVLLLLLASLRTAFISLTAIPLSLLTAVIVLQKFGITINTITLGGLAIALGEVVDDSIIDVENIFRRLREYFSKGGRDERVTESGTPAPREDQRKTSRESIFSIVLGASLEVRSAVVYATFIVALIFLPVLTLTGLQGSFFAPLAMSYILAIMASLLIALTVTPALCYALFGKGVRQTEDPVVQRYLKTGYRRVLSFIARWPRLIMGLVLVFCLAAAAVLPFFGGEFLPDFREGHFVLQVFMTPGSSLKAVRHMGQQVSQALLKNQHIDTVEQQIGRAELGEDPWGPHRSEFHVELKPTSGKEQEKMTDELRALLDKFPGIESQVTTFLGDRISETVTGETEPFVVNLFADDLDLLDAKAGEVARVLKSIPGQADVKIKATSGVPRIVVRLRFERLTALGFRPVEVLEAIESAYQGAIVGQVHRGNQVSDVSVILDEPARANPEAIGSLLLRSQNGILLPLREMAEVFPASGRFTILHEGARRRQTVTCSVTGRDVASFAREAETQIKSRVSFPVGMKAVFSGAAQTAEAARSELFLHSAIAAVGILLLLSIVLHNGRNLLLVLTNVPFALVGGVLAVWVYGLLENGEPSLSIGSLVGFVTLFGITTRNSIMMISHFEHLVVHEGMAFGPELVMRGASERLMPILMTATVTALGLLPLALGAGEAGREIEGPMAIVILGGLVTSTLLNLLVLPTLVLRYGRFAKVAG